MMEDMKSADFYLVPADVYYREYIHDIQKLQDNALKITEHDKSYNYIKGELYCDVPVILATSIPYSDGWNIVVDGELTETITVNTAFVGCYLPEGSMK